MNLCDPAPSVARPAADRPHWSLDDIPWHEIRQDAVAQTEAFFYLVATASLMESATDLYTANLIDYFADDEEVTSWLENYWLPEELQHGRALRRYVEVAWPEFGWEPARRLFVEEFKPFCDTSLEATRSQEMASRCVVETGTASYYRTLSRASPDPVLAILTRRIAEDEVRHYKHFYRYFRKYRDVEAPRRSAILPALWRRLKMTGGDDSFIVLKHVYNAHHPGEPFDMGVYRRVRRECRRLVRDHFPHEMTVRMLLKPLGLGPRTQRLTLPVIAALARCVVP
jgi:rubrerythrin